MAEVYLMTFFKDVLQAYTCLLIVIQLILFTFIIQFKHFLFSNFLLIYSTVEGIYFLFLMNRNTSLKEIDISQILLAGACGQEENP